MDLYDFLRVLKFTVQPRYSMRSRIFTTARWSQPQGSAVDLWVTDRPFSSLYAVGVSTPAAFSRLEICIGPRPAMQRLNISRTTWAASSSTSHLYLSPL